MFKASLVRAAEVSSIPMKPHVNPYTAQKIWPPDFTKMHPKHQFRLERRYRRRAKLKWARPRWVKATKLAQWGICSAVVVYGVLWMDWGTVETPFPSIRHWLARQTDSLWTSSAAQAQQPLRHQSSNAPPEETAYSQG